MTQKKTRGAGRPRLSKAEKRIHFGCRLPVSLVARLAVVSRDLEMTKTFIVQEAIEQFVEPLYGLKKFPSRQ